MKHNIDSYELSRSGKMIKYSVRIRVTMKDDVDIDVLRKSVNTAIKRYPYFRKQIIVDIDSSFDLIDNDKDIVVIETSDNLPLLGSEKVNKHLFYADCDGKDINFNISHSLAGGKGFTPLVETCLYQYVVDKYGVDVDAPGIRKPDSDLLDGEDGDIDISRFDLEDKLYLKKKKRGYTLLGAYIKNLLFPSRQNSQYYILSFDSKDIIKYSKGNDSSVASAFMVFIFKAMCKVLPRSAKNISCGISHNPVAQFGYPNIHSDILTHVCVGYNRDMEKYDNERLGTITRSQIYLQSDPNYACIELMKRFTNNANLDLRNNYISKKLYSIFKCSILSSGGGGTFMLNYTGYRDFGQLADYVESYVFLVDGHVMTEITSMSDKLFMCFMQMDQNPKYIRAIKQVFNENSIPYTIKGPFKTNHVRVELPSVLKSKICIASARQHGACEP